MSYETLSGVSGVIHNTFPEDQAFSSLVVESELALNAGFSPLLSRNGSSGCYFMQDREQVNNSKYVRQRMCQKNEGVVNNSNCGS